MKQRRMIMDKNQAIDCLQYLQENINTYIVNGCKSQQRATGSCSKDCPFYILGSCKVIEHVIAYKKINAIILADLLGEDGQSKFIPM